MTTIEWVATALGLTSVWLTVRQNIWCWPIGLVMVSLYIVIFWDAKLYADAGLHVVYVFLQLYGWYEWLHGGPQGAPLNVGRARKPWLLALLGTLGTLGLGWSLSHTDASLPYWDSFIASFSLVAQWMMARKLLECWLVWIVVDVVAVGVYLAKGLYPTAGLYVAFLALATAGFLEWRRTGSPNPR